MPIIRSLSLKSTGGISKIVEYIFKEESRYKDKRGNEMIYTRNMRKGTRQNYINQFKENLENYQKKDHKHSNKLYHFILSFSPKNNEQIDAKILKHHVRKFINLINNRAQWLCVGHDNGETPHVHAHLLLSVTELANSKSVAMSKAKFSEIQQRIQLFTKEYYPELKASIVNYGQKERELRNSETSYFQEKTAFRSKKKDRLKSSLQSIYLQNRSQDKFLDALQKNGLVPYYRGHNNRLTGIVDKSGRKYRFKTLGISKEQIKALENENLKTKELAQTTSTNSQTTDEQNLKPEKQHDQYKDVLAELREIRKISEELEQNDLELE